VRNRRTGITLPELVITLVILNSVGFFLMALFKYLAQGRMAVHDKTPLQEEAQNAFLIIQRDLVGAMRHSVMSLLPDGGFEFSPPRISNFTNAGGNWLAIPRLQATPTYAVAGPVSSPGDFFAGLQGLSIYSEENPGTYAVTSPLIAVNSGEIYLLAGWARTQAGLGLAGQGAGITWQGTVAAGSGSTATITTNWAHIWSTFTSTGGSDRLNLIVAGGPPDTLYFDCVTLSPMGVALTPANGGILQFSGLDIAGAGVLTYRYRLLPTSKGGRLMREVLDESGNTVDSQTLPYDHLAQVDVAWEGGVADTRGTNRPLVLTITTQPIPRTQPPKPYVLAGLVYPVTP
jgi:hypothetical protein